MIKTIALAFILIICCGNLANATTQAEFTNIDWCYTNNNGICRVDEIFSPGIFKNKDSYSCGAYIYKEIYKGKKLHNSPELHGYTQDKNGEFRYEVYPAHSGYYDYYDYEPFSYVWPLKIISANEFLLVVHNLPNKTKFKAVLGCLGQAK